MAEGSSTAMEVDDAPHEMSYKQKTRDAQIASLPWVEKCAGATSLSLSALSVLTWAPTRPPDRYRPKDMADLVSHEDIISTITRLIDAGKLPHLLLYGPPGTGKTSTILACAHTLYGKHFNSMVLELNASDDRGIDGD